MKTKNILYFLESRAQWKSQQCAMRSNPWWRPRDMAPRLCVTVWTYKTLAVFFIQNQVKIFYTLKVFCTRCFFVSQLCCLLWRAGLFTVVNKGCKDGMDIIIKCEIPFSKHSSLFRDRSWVQNPCGAPGVPDLASSSSYKPWSNQSTLRG